MLRIHCMQLFYNLSDPAMEVALIEIDSMLQCSTCHHERLVAFSCTNSRRFRRTTRFTPGILPSALRARLRRFKIAPGDLVCPSCGARRMAESVALFASRPELMGKVLGIVYRAIASHLIKKVGQTQKTNTVKQYFNGQMRRLRKN